MKPRFRLVAVGKEWFCMPVNDKAEALKMPAYLYTPMI